MKKIILSCFLFVLMLSLMISCSEITGDNDEPPPKYPDAVYTSPYDDPAWSPDGETIIFHRMKVDFIRECGAYKVDMDSCGLWMINADGTNMRFLLKGDESYPNHPAWAPDGRTIAFGANRQIYRAEIVNGVVDTSSITQLTPGGRNYFPDWSPDGEWITYDRSLEDIYGPSGVWIMKKTVPNAAIYLGDAIQIGIQMGI